MIETHRSFANMWECDENNHMNVQFFMKRFEEAHVVFTALHNQTNPTNTRVNHRHLRFHREIRAGESLQIFSGHVSKGQYQGRIAHHMINTVTGALCTTALDSLASPLISDVLIDDKQLSKALPRGVPDSASVPFDADRLINAGEAMVANFNVIRPHDLDEEGNFIPSRIVSMFTDGAPHVWEKAGITTSWLNDNGFGRVAVEMRVDPIAKPTEGEPLRLVSHVGALEGRTFRLDHQIETVLGKTIIATGAVRGLVMDLTTRKAVQMPEGFTGKFSN